MNIYLAGPFFNDKQIEVITSIEKLLDNFGDVVLYSPMRHGVIGIVGKDKSKAIFEDNVRAIHACDFMIAVIDDRDTGTIWEMGLAFGLNKRIITYTEQQYGLNIMLAESVQAHCQTMLQLINAMFNKQLDIPYAGDLF